MTTTTTRTAAEITARCEPLLAADRTVIYLVTYQFRSGRTWTSSVDSYADFDLASTGADLLKALPNVYRRVEIRCSVLRTRA